MERGDFIKDKSGQFYLIAAIIISVIIIAIASVSNYSQRQESVKIESIGEELKVESEKVLDYGTYHGYSTEQMQSLMDEFSRDYLNYVQNDGDFYFVFGNTNKIKVVAYSQSDKTIYVDAGAGEVSMAVNSGQISSQEFAVSTENVILDVDETDYDFELKSGENFYFVIFQETGGEKNVARN